MLPPLFLAEQNGTQALELRLPCNVLRLTMEQTLSEPVEQTLNIPALTSVNVLEINSCSPVWESVPNHVRAILEIKRS